MRRRRTISLLLTLAPLLAAAAPSELPKRAYQATRLTGPAPTIDGRLDDDCWRNLGEWTGDFTQREPHEGAAPSLPTYLKILYDDHNLYVAIRAMDPDVATRPRQIGSRDDFAGDMVGFAIDSYFDHATAFEFDVTSGGSKVDLHMTPPSSFDLSWNGIWDVKVSTEKDAWTAEYRVPLSQLRYASAKELIWGLHCWRWIKNLQEESDWQLIPMDNKGVAYSFGELHGIRELPPSRRLEFSPYSVVRYSTFQAEPGNPFRNGHDSSAEGGLDIKYGISPSVTLDATINPDFGQVEADPSEINLSTVETFLRERRPFFLEGKSIFDIKLDDDLLFYTRRIGAAPSLEPLTPGFYERPAGTRILGSAKVTGRTASGLSLGLLHATTDRAISKILTPAGIVRETAQPLSNSSVVRLSQDLNGGDTTVGLLITSELREGSAASLQALPRNAFVAGADAIHYFDSRTYFVEGRVFATSVSGSTQSITALQESSVHNYQRADASHVELDPAATSLSGNAGYLAAGRAIGTWRYQAFTSWRSPGVDFNELGYLRNADWFEPGVQLQYFTTEKNALFRRRDHKLRLTEAHDYSGTRVSRAVSLQSEMATNNNAIIWSKFVYRTSVLDTRFLRGGPALRMPSSLPAYFYFESDATKPWQITFDGGYTLIAERGSSYVNLNPGFVGRINGRLKAGITLGYESNRRANEYVAQAPLGASTTYIVGRLKQDTLFPTVRLEMNFTPTCSLTYYGGPFASTGRYTDFKRVVQPRASHLGERFTAFSAAQDSSGYYANINGSTLRYANPNFDWRELKSNLVLRWEYKPGSSLYCVWSQHRTDTEDQGAFNTSRQLESLLGSHPDNTILLKISYWFSI